MMAASANKPSLKQKVLTEPGPQTTTDGNVPTYQLKLEEILQPSGSPFCLYEYGKAPMGYKNFEKVLLMVGATGAGKTTLINSLINYVFGVEYADDYRLKLISETTNADQSKSQTKHICTYTLHHQEGFKVPYTLTIINTPGYGDTAGIWRDKEITKDMHAFFKDSGIVDHIDAVGFVGQAALPRLTILQKYIFDSILSLFGKDISNNIFLLLTFCDSQKPQILSAMKEAGIPHKGYFKFNNSVVFTKAASGYDNSGDSDEVDACNKIFWTAGMKNFQIFTTKLANISPQSLLLTQEVLEQRCLMETFIEKMDVTVQEGLVKLTRLRTEENLFQKYEKVMKENKDFEIKVDVIVERDEIVKDNFFKKFMNGVLTVLTFTIVELPPTYCKTSKREKRTETLAEVKARYEKAQGKKMTANQVIGAIRDELKSIQKREYQAIEEIRKCLNTLKEIALKPTQLSTVDYIDLMIKNEQENGLEGWQERVEELKIIRKISEYLGQFEAGKEGEPCEEIADAIRNININSEEMDPKERKPSSNEPIASPQVEKRIRCKMQ